RLRRLTAEKTVKHPLPDVADRCTIAVGIQDLSCGIEEVVLALVACDAGVQLVPRLHEGGEFVASRARQARDQFLDVDFAAVNRLGAEQLWIFLENIRADRCGRGLRHVNPPDRGPETPNYIRR